MKYKILHLSWRDYYNPKKGGAEVTDFEIYTRLVKQGHSVTWLAAEFPGSLPQENVNGISYVRMGNFFSVHKLARQYYKKNESNFDIVIDELHGYPFFTLGFVNKPTATIIYEVAGEIWFKMWKFPVAHIGYLAEKLVYRLISNSIFITSSDSTKQDLISQGAKNLIHVLKLGSNFKPESLTSIKKQELQLCFAGRICRMKGITELLQAVALVKQTVPQIKLVLVGRMDPEYEQEFNDVVNNLDLKSNITVTGFITEQEKRKIMMQSKYLVSCSVKEGFGLIVIEAARVGTPSITFNVNAYKDIIQNNVTGYLVPEYSVNLLNQTIINALQNKDYALMQLAAQSYSLEFNWDNCAKEFENLLPDLKIAKYSFVKATVGNLFINMAYLAGSILHKLKVIKV